MSSFQCHVARVGGASSAKEVVGISVRGRKDGTLHTGFGVCVCARWNQGEKHQAEGLGGDVNIHTHMAKLRGAVSWRGLHLCTPTRAEPSTYDTQVVARVDAPKMKLK